MNPCCAPSFNIARFFYACIKTLLMQRAIACGDSLGMRELLVVHPDFTDDIEIRPTRLDYEKLAHFH